MHLASLSLFLSFRLLRFHPIYLFDRGRLMGCCRYVAHGHRLADKSRVGIVVVKRPPCIYRKYRETEKR